MTTAELIEALGGAAAPVAPAGAGRLGWPVVAGAAAAAVILLVWLGVRPLAPAFASASYWMKAAYTLALGAAGAMMTWRLARPGRPIGRAPLVVAAALGVVGALALAQLAGASAGEARTMWLGQSWTQCPWRIVVLAAPIFVGAFWGLRRLAPTRLAAAGAAAGLMAGGAGATVYGLFCQETTAAFLVTWYTLGIAACAGLGALLGPRLLRW